MASSFGMIGGTHTADTYRRRIGEIGEMIPRLPWERQDI